MTSLAAKFIQEFAVHISPNFLVIAASVLAVFAVTLVTVLVKRHNVSAPFKIQTTFCY